LAINLASGAKKAKKNEKSKIIKDKMDQASNKYVLEL
jgi:hypothetical protein